MSKEFKTPLSSYVPGEYDGTNKCGWQPSTDNVLVLPDLPLKKTKGGIEIPDAITDRTALAAESGILIACGPDAFIWNQDRTRRLEGKERPKEGQRVVFNRYSGIKCNGDDGQEYLIMADHSVKAVRDR